MPQKPQDYRIDRENRRVVSVVLGVYNLKAATARMRRLLKEPDFEATFSLLMDFRQATAVDLSHDEIVQLSEMHVFAADSRRAYVVASAEQFGLARMFAAYRAPKSGSAFRIFTSMDEAIAWLDEVPKQGPAPLTAVVAAPPKV